MARKKRKRPSAYSRRMKAREGKSRTWKRYRKKNGRFAKKARGLKVERAIRFGNKNTTQRNFGR